MRHLACVWMAIGLCLYVGCDSVPSDQEVRGGNQDALEELSATLKMMAGDKKQPPQKMAQFKEIEPELPIAAPLIKEGDIIYIWGAAYEAGSNKVIAYEKTVTTDGGSVLLQDGTVKKMTADEFKAAPKAK